MRVEIALLGVLVLRGASTAGGGRHCPLFTRLLTLGCGVRSSSSASGRGASSFIRVTLTRGSPTIAAAPLDSTLTGIVTPLLFCFLMFIGFAVFYGAFIVAAISARSRTAEMVPVLHRLTVFTFLLALQLEHASTPPTTVGGVAASTLVVRRTAVEKISGFFACGGGGLLHVFQLSTTALPSVRPGLRPPPSRTLLSRGRPSRMFAQVIVRVRVMFPCPWLTPSTHRPGHHRCAYKLSFQMSSCSSPLSWEGYSLEAKGEDLSDHRTSGSYAP